MKPLPLTLRRRLLLAGGVGILLVSAIATWVLGSLFAIAAHRSLDRELQGDLIALLALVESDAQGRLQLRHELDDQRYGRIFSGAYWQVFDTQGNALLQSRSLWDDSLHGPGPLADGVAQSYDLAGPAQQPLRALARQVILPRSQRPLQFVVAVDRTYVQQDVAMFRKLTAAALAVLTALWLAVLLTQVHFGLQPLANLGLTAARVRAGEDARFHEQGLPGEVLPLVKHLNELLDHHRRMVARARTSAGDLAHALKTPLSVLMSLGERPPPNWQPTLREQTVRMNASIERYLAAGIAVDAHQRMAVKPVAVALASFLQRAHQDRQIQIAVNVDDDAVFAGAREDLEEMLGNLLDNACRWARTAVSVQAAMVAGTLCIEVRDDGPGIPEDKLQAVLVRGVRLDERECSTGLGLSIVMDIALSYAGVLSLANQSPGLQATLRFAASD